MKLDRLRLHLPLPLLVAFEDRSRAGSEGAMIEERHIRAKKEKRAKGIGHDFGKMITEGSSIGGAI
jgi:hypothetical protein